MKWSQLNICGGTELGNQQGSNWERSLEWTRVVAVKRWEEYIKEYEIILFLISFGAFGKVNLRALLYYTLVKRILWFRDKQRQIKRHYSCLSSSGPIRSHSYRSPKNEQIKIPQVGTLVNIVDALLCFGFVSFLGALVQWFISGLWRSLSICLSSHSLPCSGPAVITAMRDASFQGKVLKHLSFHLCLTHLSNSCNFTMSSSSLPAQAHVSQLTWAV